MPSVSKKQRKFMGSELSKSRAGEKTQTNMSESQLSDYASTPESGLPERRAHAPKRKR
jgi:hypothetical protein